MSYIGINWPIATPPVDEIYTIDFVNQLREGERVTSANVSFILSQGEDPDVPSRVIGSFFITDDTLVSQRIRGLLPGNIYNLSITAVTSLGFTPELNSYIVCEAIF